MLYFKILSFRRCIFAADFKRNDMAKTKKKVGDAEECEIYLYGIIGRGLEIDTNVLIARLEESRKAGARKFTFYVNSDGGEVAQGSALFNYLDRTDVEVTWVVDGIAASMMAVLMTNPKHHVKAARYAKFMYHRVCGYVYGNSDETRAAADMMDNFEGTLVDMLASRTGLSKEEARSRYFDGVDHWLSAEDALREKLCDEIINTGRDIKEIESITNSRDAFNYYNNQIINLNKREMKDPKAFASALNINETDDESVVLGHVKTVVNERETLRQQLQAEQAKTTELENRVKAFEGAKVKNLIDGAIADKRIGEDDREAYTKLAEQDFDNTEKILNKMKPVGRIKDQLPKEGAKPEESGWDFDKYHQAGRLENLKKDNPDRYAELFKAKFGHEPQN